MGSFTNGTKTKRIFYNGTKIKRVYNGKQLVWQSVVEAGSIKFTKSQNWVVPDGIKKIDIFCCGGGGGAGGTVETTTVDGIAYLNYYYYGSTGAGGYTNTVLSYNVTPGQTLNITVGAGGAAGTYYHYQKDNGNNEHLGNVTSTSSVTNGSAGGASSVVLNGTTVVSAAGGQGGNKNISSNYVNGVNGGSGSASSGCRVYAYTGGTDAQADYVYFPSEEGKDGANGSRSGYNNLKTFVYEENKYGAGGTGQGRTTKAFAEANGELYSSAGANLSETASNMGHGGGIQFKPYAGSGGAVIIRWAQQEM